MEKHEYVMWGDLTKNGIKKLSKKELAKRKKEQEEQDRKEKLVIDALVERFDEFFDIVKKDDRVDYILEWGSVHSSDGVFLGITTVNNCYNNCESRKEWCFYSHRNSGFANGEIFDTPQEAFRGFLNDSNYGCDSLLDDPGAPEWVEELIEQDL